MPEICRFYGIIIYLYVKDHNPPHIHAEYGEYEALFNINTNEVYSGKLPSRAERLVKEWIELHQIELIEDWNNAKTGNTIFKITPLK